jgi:hypothetical protein
MTIATANSGRQRTPTDGLSQATRATTLVIRTVTWLRDEEANASGEDCSAGSLTELP